MKTCRNPASQPQLPKAPRTARPKVASPGSAVSGSPIPMRATTPGLGVSAAISRPARVGIRAEVNVAREVDSTLRWSSHSAKPA
jgi:hypothetical protein